MGGGGDETTVDEREVYPELRCREEERERLRSEIDRQKDEIAKLKQDLQLEQIRREGGVVRTGTQIGLDSGRHASPCTHCQRARENYFYILHPYLHRGFAFSRIE